MKPRILLLSAYDASSHRRWREELLQLFPAYEWVSLIGPPRHFNWRIRGNSLLWGFAESTKLKQPYDLVLATSMVDLSSLRGFIPSLGTIPTVVYFHENQFVYPAGKQRDDNVEPQLVPLYTALCADRIVFNSQYNRQSFLEGAASLFKRLPDTIHPGVLAKLESSTVIPVPVADCPARRNGAGVNAKLLEIVWNHRWEYDKGISLLLQLVRQLHQGGLAVRLHIVGEQFRQQPAEFEQINSLLDEHASHVGINRGEFGFMENRGAYQQLLADCDVVLSTALHDFQGLAVMEACMAGCCALAPHALVYPEYLGPTHLYPLASNDAETAATIIQRLVEWQALKASGRALPLQDLDAYAARAVRVGYAKLFEELITETQ